MENDMRDRLVELIQNSVDGCASYWAELIADHLIANGVIVPPCKVGDKVYCINTFFQNDTRINVCEVDAIHITSGKNKFGHKKPSYALVRDTNMKQLSSRIYFENFGKTVFLTKEQAEQKLKEMRVENELL